MDAGGPDPWAGKGATPGHPHPSRGIVAAMTDLPTEPAHEPGCGLDTDHAGVCIPAPPEDGQAAEAEPEYLTSTRGVTEARAITAHGFALELGVTGPERLELAGVDVARRTEGVVVRWVRGEVPTVTVELTPDGLEAMTAAGIAIVQRPSPDALETLTAFLEGLDADAVERAALERAGWDTGASAAKLVIDHLRDLVNPQPPPSSPTPGG